MKNFVRRNYVNLTDASVNCMLGGIGIMYASDMFTSILAGLFLLPIQEFAHKTKFSIQRWILMVVYGVTLAAIPLLSQFCPDLESYVQMILRTIAHFLYWANWKEEDAN